MVIAPPRWSTLYADALYSIFQFASLHELARLMSVSGRWRHAVMSMPPIAAADVLDEEPGGAAQLTCLIGSRMRRHVA